VLLRHGETADNLAGRFLGRSDPPLTAEGLERAHRARGGIDLGGDCTVVSSPARRAIETAAALGAAAPEVDDGFRELDFGAWEGLTPDEVAQQDPATYAAFARGVLAAFPEGESVAEVWARTSAAIATRVADRLVVVTHATVIRVVVAGLLGVPIDHYRARFGRPGHLSLTELEHHTGGWRLVAYGVPTGA
jgi:broad specificity phosphatase PhoE